MLLPVKCVTADCVAVQSWCPAHEHGVAPHLFYVSFTFNNFFNFSFQYTDLASFLNLFKKNSSRIFILF